MCIYTQELYANRRKHALSMQVSWLDRSWERHPFSVLRYFFPVKLLKARTLVFYSTIYVLACTVVICH